ncbi:MAG: hypothetical protein IPH03_14130 [Tetrasphaera sp.]|nr:hypothetical protein [Tetrasphaera sp.]
MGEGVPSRNTARGNVIVSNLLGGIMIDKGHNRVQILDNWIGVTKSGTAGGNLIVGISMQRGPWNQTIQGNVIANSPTAIQISSLGGDPPGKEQTTYGNLISRNSMYNTQGIAFDYQSSPSMVQHGIKPPTLTAGSESGSRARPVPDAGSSFSSPRVRASRRAARTSPPSPPTPRARSRQRCRASARGLRSRRRRRTPPGTPLSSRPR